jgi:hypothetical protein
MSSKICVIHQPNFLPWLGYFQRLQQADIFVLLDDAQYQKKGSNYENRVQFNFNGEAKWFTIPVYRPSGVQSTKEVLIASSNWRKKLKNSLHTYYGKAPFFNDFKDIIFAMIEFQTDSMFEFNVNSLEISCDLLGIPLQDKMLYSSSLDLNSTSTNRLVDICHKVGADTYLSGNGGRLYQDEALFQKNNIILQYQKYGCPHYPQVSTRFVSGLSLLDALFCVGINKVKSILD